MTIYMANRFRVEHLEKQIYVMKKREREYDNFQSGQLIFWTHFEILSNKYRRIRFWKSKTTTVIHLSIYLSLMVFYSGGLDKMVKTRKGWLLGKCCILKMMIVADGTLKISIFFLTNLWKLVWGPFLTENEWSMQNLELLGMLSYK